MSERDPFRDDHEAALARVTSLEDEVERWKADALQRKADYALLQRDNERLQAENDELRAKVPKPKPVKPVKPAKPKRENTGGSWWTARRRAQIGWTAGILAIGALVTIPPTCECRQQDRYKRDVAAHELAVARWHALTELEDCLRESTDAVADFAAQNPAELDPRQSSRSVSTSRLTDRCVDKLGPVLVAIPSLAPVAETIARWRHAGSQLGAPAKALGTYYENKDWKDDNYAAAPALWQATRAPLARYREAIDAAWRDVVPAARAEIKAIQAAYEQRAGRSLQWWRIELGFAWNDLVDAGRAYKPSGELQRLARELKGQIAQAPLELRRELRDLDEDLDRIIGGYTQRAGELREYSLWPKTQDAGVGPLPKRPEQHEGCGDGAP